MKIRKILEKIFVLSFLLSFMLHGQAYPNGMSSSNKYGSYDNAAIDRGQIDEVYGELRAQTLVFGVKLAKSVAMRLELGFKELFAISSSTHAAQFKHLITASTNGQTGDVDYSFDNKRNALFGAKRIKFGQISGTTRISNLLKSSVGSKTNILCEDKCVTLARELGQMVSGAENKLGVVTRAVNHIITYEKDDVHQSNRDFWSTAAETLLRSKGDCEDYAILKMAVLTRVGIPLSAMEIVVVKDKHRDLFHAVLSVSLNGKNFILDNLTDKTAVDVEISNYQPMYSVSQQATYIFGKTADISTNVVSAGYTVVLAPGHGL